MQVTWLTEKMLDDCGYVMKSNKKAIVKQWYRAGKNRFPRFHVTKDGKKWDIHLDKKEKHGLIGGGRGKNILTSGEVIEWELARIRNIYYKKKFKKAQDNLQDKTITGLLCKGTEKEDNFYYTI